ncbi:hypothetical protein [Plantactinospora sp. CA-290183]|uniref:hypothetical protein n=1 Tax=Plantactinospora sp. CA-290183 TaxID=3240006 RepID=UPI003D8FB786
MPVRVRRWRLGDRIDSERGELPEMSLVRGVVLAAATVGGTAFRWALSARRPAPDRRAGHRAMRQYGVTADRFPARSPRPAGFPDRSPTSARGCR